MGFVIKDNFSAAIDELPLTAFQLLKIQRRMKTNITSCFFMTDHSMGEGMTTVYRLILRMKVEKAEHLSVKVYFDSRNQSDPAFEAW